MFWLNSQGLGQFSEAFVAFGINGHVLCEGLSEEDLIELGISSRLQRKKVQTEIKYAIKLYSARPSQGTAVHGIILCYCMYLYCR